MVVAFECKKKHTPSEMGVFLHIERRWADGLRCVENSEKTTQVGTHLGGEKQKTTVGLPHKNVISYAFSIPQVWCKSQEGL